MSFSASSRVIVSRDIVERRDAVFGFGASFFLRGFLSSPVFLSGTSSGSGNTSVTYGPKRPDLASRGNCVSGCVPK